MKLSDKLKSFLWRSIWTFLVSLLVSFILLVTVVYPSQLITQSRMETWASYAGGLQAKVWFKEGKYRLLELQPFTEIDSAHLTQKFTDKKEGPFEIWTWPDYQATNSNVLNWLTKDISDQVFVDSFNDCMKRLWNEMQKTNSLQVKP